MKNRKTARPTKATRRAQPAKPAAAPRPRGRPPKARPGEAPPAALALLESLLLRLVSPLKALPVQTSDALIYVRPEDIAYISTSPDPKERKIIIVDREGREWRRFDVLTKLFERLSPDQRFFMTHKSCIVNLFAAKTLRTIPGTSRNELTFGDKVKGTAPVSADRLKELATRMEL